MVDQLQVDIRALQRAPAVLEAIDVQEFVRSANDLLSIRSKPATPVDYLREARLESDRVINTLQAKYVSLMTKILLRDNHAARIDGCRLI